ncbi:lipid A deacylase LpxR family protein [Vibrio alfacsensis]|uniref:lipid A deacylase LpxR family protein n=1 Tax=Vibrio alfacsensis TaxID=1074311 RepID=UPI002ADE5ED2|nr:lipid A deacylase LpxR family protein [Vibrio alfacsensis]WQE75348.1 lipid A deacylase LpxR family protein [Vibrio alfacsensis]
MKLSKLFALALLSPVAIASTKSTISFTLDNDGIFGVDQDYTNGIFLSYATEQLRRDAEWGWLSLNESSNQTNVDKIELVLGHKMWTPSDIEADYPLVNDRPYAGYLHTEINYLTLTADRAVRYNFTIGATGESSLSDKAQDIVHGITGSTDPQGWEYQIDDEIAFSVGYRAFNKLMRSEASTQQWEITNVTDINAGNFRSDISQGVMFRWGTNLANSIGAANISVESPFHASMIAKSTSSWFLFTGFEGRYRFNDITIEGDRSGIPEPSEPYDVTLQNWQASAVAGATWYNQNYGASLTFTVKTPDYKEAQTDVYGTGSLSLFAFF